MEINLGYKVNELSETMDKLTEDVEQISIQLTELQDTMVKLWRAEDMEENKGKFRWPFGEHGNLLPNVSITGRENK